MFRRFSATLSAGTTTTLFTVSSGRELSVPTVSLWGGDEGGVVTLTVNDGNADIFTQRHSVAANNTLILDHVEFYPAGYSLKAMSDVTGVQVTVSAEDTEIGYGL